jgi:hypothetical protein
MAGSAPVAQTWLLIEQPGPWGRDAVTESHLPADLGRRLQRQAKTSGVRLGLIRHPGRHADPDPARRIRRLVLVARTVPGHTSLHYGWASDGQLPTLLAALTRPGEVSHRALGLAQEDELRAPLLLVCTNGHRDPCCAREGLRLAAALNRTHPGHVWETTHLGGHRFAPTALLLPWGTVHGRLNRVEAAALLDAAGRGELLTTGYRGRSAFTRPAQVAEAAVRARLGVTGPDDLTAQARPTGEDRWEATVRHVDGRVWTCPVTRSDQPLGPRRTSCFEPPELVRPLVAGPLTSQ